MQITKSLILIVVFCLLACKKPPFSELISTFDLGDRLGVVTIYRRFSVVTPRISIGNKTGILFQDDRLRIARFSLGFSTRSAAGLIICDGTYEELFLAWRRSDLHKLSEQETHDLIKQLLAAHNISFNPSLKLDDILCAGTDNDGTLYEKESEAQIRKHLKARAGTKGVLYLD